MTTLTLAGMGRHGEAVGEWEGKPVYILYGLPGETVEAELAGSHGMLRRIVAASPERIDPFCPHFGRCGGCQIQHWRKEAYAAWKRGLVVTALDHRGIEAKVEPLIDAHGTGRRRAILHVAKTKDGIVAGFNAARSHEVHPIKFCPILDPALARAPLIACEIGDAIGRCDVFFAASDAGLDVNIMGSRKIKAPRLSDIAHAEKLARISIDRDPLVTRAIPEIVIGRARLRLPPGSFLQPTKAGEDALAALVNDGIGRAKRIADLFCGVGVFALRLAETARIYAADSDELAIATLAEAARHTQGLKPIEAKTRDLFREPLMARELNAFDAVVFDPPRAGAEAQARQLAKSDVGTVVAVSCDPASFARDAAILIAGGFTLSRVTPVDQFAYTAHVEIVGVFRR